MIINSMTPFTLTDSAKQQMSSLLSKNPSKDAVSLSVKGGGCAGFQYEWGFLNDNQINDNDIISTMPIGTFAGSIHIPGFTALAGTAACFAS